MDRLKSLLTEEFAPSSVFQPTQKDVEQDLRAHADEVTKLPDTAHALLAANPQTVLEWLNPARHTISYAVVLKVLLKPTNLETMTDRAWLQRKVENFLAEFDWLHIRLVGASLTRILSRISANEVFTPQRTIELLANTILRIDPTGAVFTSTHVILANLALTIGVSEAALEVFGKDITAYPAATSLRSGRPLCDPSLSPTVYVSVFTGLTDPIKASAVLDYGTALGQIYISQKEWLKARLALEKVITHPMKDKGVVKAMSTAYKRWILVGLLGGGKTPSLPAYTPSSSKAHYSSLKAYNALADAFDASDPAQLQTELTTHGSTYEDDGNGPLIREVLQAYQKWQVINLHMTYSRISTSRIREETFSGETGQRLPSTEAMAALLREMIGSGMLKAGFELDEHGNETYLAFQEDTQSLTEKEFAQEIARRHKAISELTTQYKAANERLGGNKEYIKHVYREQKRQPEDGNPMSGFDASVEDEDLMVDVKGP